METLKTKIEGLKKGRTLAQLKIENAKTYYKVQSLSAKLSQQKAVEKRQFVTKNDLVEYKGLIIWLMKNKCNYRGYLNLKEAMTDLLKDIETRKVVYITRRGIKGIISRMAIECGLHNSEDNLRRANGIEWTTNTNGNSVLEDFSSFRINTLM